MRYANVLGAALVLLTVGSASGVDISTCGQTVPRGETGVLVVDLVCPSGPDTVGVTLEDRATLNLNGHSIEGGHTTVDALGRTNTVVGPGHIEGSLLFKKGLRISDVTVSGGHFGVFSGMLGRLDATNVTVTGATTYGIRGGVIRGSNLVANGNGIHGIECLRLLADNVTANDNAQNGIACKRVRSTGVTTHDNGAAGVESSRNSYVTNLTSTGNGRAGYLGYFSGGTLRDSTVDDIVSKRRPRLRGTTTCTGKSYQFDPFPGTGLPFGTWSVCAGD